MDGQTVCAASAAEPGADRHPAAEEAFVAVLRQAVTAVLDWQERAAQRRQLVGLGPHLLKDTGIDPADAFRETSKPFWRA